MRLLFDEQLSWRVARALRELGINASHVGHEDDAAPPRGSGDRVVLDHARKTNQIIVTSNHDMILLCAEEGESVIWIDPRGRQLRRAEFVSLAFNRVEEWEHIRLYAFEWGVRVRMRGGLGRSGQVTPPAWRSTRSR